MTPDFVHRATLVDPTVSPDERGDPVYSYTPGVRRLNVPCRIARAASIELRGARLASLTDWVSLWPAGTAMDERTRVEWRDKVLEVDGEPDRVEDLAGDEDYVHAKLRRVVG